MAVTVVVGGSGSIGSACVERALSAGHQVIVGYHSRPTFKNQSLLDRRDIELLPIELGDSASVEHFVGEVFRRYGEVDNWICSAGFSSGRQGFLDRGMEELKLSIDVNLTGVACLVLAIGRGVVACRKKEPEFVCNIVLLSSEAGIYGGKGIVGYAVAKAGLNMLVKASARELGACGIRINAVSPGVIESRMHGGEQETELAGMIKQIPLGRIGTADEVSDLVFFLCSPKASYITGTVVSISGGR